MDPTDDHAVPLKTLLRWSETLSAIARTGLGFTESLYEQERFEEILKVAADIRAEADGQGDAPDAGGLVQEWMDTVGKGVPGYVTPKVAVGVAVGNDRGELLLIQRADSGIWLAPDRLVRRGLLRGRDRGQGGRGGDRASSWNPSASSRSSTACAWA